MDKLFNVGLFPSSSILFTGPPGVGKTMAARWLAAQLKIPLLVLNLASVMNNWLGKTGLNLQNVFNYAKRYAGVALKYLPPPPCVICGYRK